jgi:hypothetical protein
MKEKSFITLTPVCALLNQCFSLGQFVVLGLHIPGHGFACGGLQGVDLLCQLCDGGVLLRHLLLQLIALGLEGSSQNLQLVGRALEGFDLRPML